VLIFPEADVSFPVHHAEAANTLLKTLEEPRRNVHFVLLAERPDRLLTTIRSRAQSVRFTALSTSLVRDILQRHDVPADAQPAAIALAQGRADVALRLAEDHRAERLLEVALRIDDAVHERRVGVVLDLAEDLASSDDRTLLLDTLALFYRDVASLALLGPDAQLSFPQRTSLIETRAQALGAQRAARRVQRIDEAREALGRNANPEVAMDAMLFSLS
jgi:DNA polymerase III subunit delta'